MHFQLAGVVIFSAIPFTTVKVIANSPLGERLQRRLSEQKSVAVQKSIQRNKIAQLARNNRLMLEMFNNQVDIL